MNDNRGVKLVRTYDINMDCMVWSALSTQWKENQWPGGVSDHMELSYDELMDIYTKKLEVSHSLDQKAS